MKIVAMLMLLVPAIALGEPAPWPAAVEGFVPPGANEHPRLFFRKADVPKLRERAKTPEGRLIVARLKKLLGGGEAMPTHFSKTAKAYADLKEDLPLGTYTLWHGAGFGMLYQLTGEQKYADLGRECVEKAFAGQRDRDDRYAYVEAGGLLRAGPSIGAIAMAYDLNFDGWDPAFRKLVAGKIQDYRFTTGGEGKEPTVDRMARNPKHAPGSNHFGCQVGGAGLALLAIRGDDGVDHARVEKLLPDLEKNIVRALTQGFGDHGYFWEHPGPGQIASDTALTPMLQAMKVAGGRDYITPRPNAQWMTLRWVMEIVPDRDGQPYYPNRHPSSYGTEFFERVGLSRGGQFSQGFGAVDEKYKPAMLWTYQNFVEPGEPKLAIPSRKEKDPDQWLAKGEKSLDAILYPHRAVLALVNWPIGEKPLNPGEVLPRAVCDSIRQYYVFRDRWQDSDDIVVTALMGARSEGRAEPITVWGLGMRTQFPVALGQARSAVFEPQNDGSGVVAVPTGRDKHYSFAVDFSGQSGAPLLIAMAGGVSAKADSVKKGENGVSAVTTVVQAGDVTYTLFTLQKGDAPKPVAEENAVRIGKQRVMFDGKKMVLGE